MLIIKGAIVKNYILSVSMIFISSQMHSSENSEIFSWIQSTLLPQKMEKSYFFERSKEEAESLFSAYRTCKYEELALVKNDQIKIPKKASVISWYNHDKFFTTLEGRILNLSSVLALRHRWISSGGKPHVSYFYLQEKTFESCSIVGAYKKLLDITKEEEVKVFFHSSKNQK